MVLLFCSPSAFLEPSWLQDAIFIDFRRVLPSPGGLLGLSWEGFGTILAPCWAYLDLCCGCLGRVVGLPCHPFGARMESRNSCFYVSIPDANARSLPLSRFFCLSPAGSGLRWAAVAPPTGLSIEFMIQPPGKTFI